MVSKVTLLSEIIASWHMPAVCDNLYRCTALSVGRFFLCHWHIIHFKAGSVFPFSREKKNLFFALLNLIWQKPSQPGKQKPFGVFMTRVKLVSQSQNYMISFVGWGKNWHTQVLKYISVIYRLLFQIPSEKALVFKIFQITCVILFSF